MKKLIITNLVSLFIVAIAFAGGETKQVSKEAARALVEAAKSNRDVARQLSKIVGPATLANEAKAASAILAASANPAYASVIASLVANSSVSGGAPVVASGSASLAQDVTAIQGGANVDVSAAETAVAKARAMGVEEGIFAEGAVDAKTQAAYQRAADLLQRRAPGVAVGPEADACLKGAIGAEAGSNFAKVIIAAGAEAERNPAIDTNEEVLDTVIGSHAGVLAKDRSAAERSTCGLAVPKSGGAGCGIHGEAAHLICEKRGIEVATAGK